MVVTEPTLGRSNKVSVKTDSIHVPSPKLSPSEQGKQYAKYGKLGGRPRVSDLVQSGEAFEKTKDHWTEIALDLISQAKALTREIKKQPSKELTSRLSQVIVQAGIAFDKVEKTKSGGGQEVDIHPFLAKKLASKVIDNQALTAKVALLSEECDRYKMLLQASDEGMIGP